MQEMTSGTTTPKTRFDAPARIQLRRSHARGEWVTHQQNMQSGALFSGNYFLPLAESGGEDGAYMRAFKDYVRRCEQLGVNPAPELGDVVIIRAGKIPRSARKRILAGQHELAMAYDAHLTKEIEQGRRESWIERSQPAQNGELQPA